MLTDVEDQIGMMFDKQHTDPALGYRVDQRSQTRNLLAGKARGGFIEQKESWLGHQRAGNFQEA